MLVYFAPSAIDALADRLPPVPEPDDAYFARRLWIWAQHADLPTPNDPALLQGVFETLFRAPNAEQTLLAAPHRADGRERAALEQRLMHAAKVLLWERRITT